MQARPFFDSFTPSGFVRLCDNLPEGDVLQALRVVAKKEPNVHRLLLSNSPLVGDAVEIINELLHLQMLSLSGCRIASTRSRLTSPQLRRVTFDHSKWYSPICEFIHELHLERLSARDTSLSDTDIEMISETQHPSLRELNIGETEITATGINSLVHLSRLNELRMSGLKCTNAYDRLGTLAELPIEMLDVSTSGLTDENVAAISSISTLTSIILDCNKVSYRGLRLLTRLPQLRNLQLDDVPISESEVVKLMEMAPKVTIGGIFAWGFVDGVGKAQQIVTFSPDRMQRGKGDGTDRRT